MSYKYNLSIFEKSLKFKKFVKTMECTCVTFISYRKKAIYVS